MEYIVVLIDRNSFIYMLHSAWIHYCVYCTYLWSMTSIECNIIPILYDCMLYSYIFIFPHVTYIHRLNHDTLPETNMTVRTWKWMDAWNTTFLSFWDLAYFQVQTCCYMGPSDVIFGPSRYGTFLASKSGPALKGLVGLNPATTDGCP